MTTTALFCCTIMIVIAIYDAIAVSIGGIDASVSGWLQTTAMQSPAFSFGFGFLAGHFFGYMKPKQIPLWCIEPTSGNFVKYIRFPSGIEVAEYCREHHPNMDVRWWVVEEIEPTKEPYNYKRDILIACALFALAAILTFFMVR